MIIRVMAPSKTIDQPISGNTWPGLRLVGGKHRSADPMASAKPGKLGGDGHDEAQFFLRCGIGKPHVDAATRAARINATTIERELIAEGLIEPKLYYRWLAGELGLQHIDHIDPAEVVRLPSMDVLLRSDGPIRLSRQDRQITVIAPEARRLEEHKAQIRARPGLQRSLAAASPAIIREAVWQAGAGDRVRQTTFQLDQDHRDTSARRVMTAAQGFLLGLVLFFSMTGILLWPFLAFTMLHLVLTLFFSGCILLRLTALIASGLMPRKLCQADISDGVRLPVYTVLVALHDEAAMVPALVSRISALRWPKTLLDIKYVCEADDVATISALLAQNLGPQSEIVRTPGFGPRTKPKALQYALQGARGSLIAVYDAEDKPAPGQLLEAWTAFFHGEARLGCLQAPLAIANLRSNWISGLFALEYSGLFRVLIPFLARAGMPIPLGGTSNHFRRSALDAVGGWDPHNVTEDADLGMRLYAHGYRTGTLRSATVETAPVSLDVWIRQRTRWLKGWTQTWLVVMRRPMRTFRALGPVGFLVFQLMIAGMLVSALAHPLMFVFIGLTLIWLASGTMTADPTLYNILMWADIINISGSYLAFIALGFRGFTKHERTRIRKRWLMLTPVYWLLMSFSGWRALGQLMTNTHLWEKTPHHPTP